MAAVFAFVRLCARIAEDIVGTNSREIDVAACEDRSFGAVEKTSSLFGLSALGAVLQIVANSFLSSNDLLGLSGL